MTYFLMYFFYCFISVLLNLHRGLPMGKGFSRGICNVIIAIYRRSLIIP